MKNPLLPAYRGLILVALLATLLAFRANEFDAPGFGLNLLTEVIGIGVTLFFVDRVFRALEQARERKYTLVVHRRLRMPFQHHLTLWSMVFSSARKNIEKKAPEFTKALNPDTSFSHYALSGRVESLVAFDSLADAPVFPPMPWMRYLTLELDRFKTQLSQILDAYAPFLPPEELERVEACLNSTLMIAMPQMLHLPLGASGKPIHPFHAIEEGQNRVPSFVPIHLRAVHDMINLLNRSLEPKERIEMNAKN